MTNNLTDTHVHIVKCISNVSFVATFKI